MLRPVSSSELGAASLGTAGLGDQAKGTADHFGRTRPSRIREDTSLGVACEENPNSLISGAFLLAAPSCSEAEAPHVVEIISRSRIFRGQEFIRVRQTRLR